MRRNPRISRWQIGQFRKDWLHAQQLAWCPQGVHANSFAAVQQTKQTEVSPEGSIIAIRLWKAVTITQKKNYSKKVLENQIPIVPASCRISAIRTLGFWIFSSLPSRWSICFCTMIEETNSSTSKGESSARQAEKSIKIKCERELHSLRSESERSPCVTWRKISRR